MSQDDDKAKTQLLKELQETRPQVDERRPEPDGRSHSDIPERKQLEDPDLDREEVGASDLIPVRLQERPPRGWSIREPA